jgi:hypothetical protein
MPAGVRRTAADEQATFTFKGTLKERRRATIKDLPVDDRTCVVTVDQIIEAPPAMAALSGHDVTVRIGRGPVPAVGQEMIFHTNGWIFGDGVAVQAVRQEAVQRSHTAVLSRGGDPVQHKRQRDLQGRFDEASLVVSGRVTAVRLPPGAAGSPRRRTRAAAADPPLGAPRPASEHDPHWREAVIEVDDVHKGRHAKKDVVIRFPASTDVRWYKAPKFQAGHQGFFMLHQTTIGAPPEHPAGRRKARTAAAKREPEAGEQVYTAVSPMDFQPYHEPDGIRALIAARPAAPGS